MGTDWRVLASTRNGKTAGSQSIALDLARLDLEVGEGRCLIGFDRDGLTRRRRHVVRRLLPDDELLAAGRHVLDLEVPLLVGHREVGAVANEPIGFHPGMNIAGHLDWSALRGAWAVLRLRVWLQDRVENGI